MRNRVRGAGVGVRLCGGAGVAGRSGALFYAREALFSFAMISDSRTDSSTDKRGKEFLFDLSLNPGAILMNLAAGVGDDWRGANVCLRGQASG